MLNYDETKIWSKIVKPSLANGNLLRRKNRPPKARPRSRGTLVLGLDEADKDRKALERLFKDLVSQGNKLSVEYDSPAKRDC